MTEQTSETEQISETDQTPDARRIHAALANPQTRELWARVVLGQDLRQLNARERRGLDQLEQAGLMRWEQEGPGIAARPVPTEVFRQLLSSGKAPTATGYERFLEKGRVVRWPSKAADKHGLILWIMRQCLAPGESVGERELSERIGRFSDDPALIRRYCVDLGELKRTPDGGSYHRAP